MTDTKQNPANDVKVSTVPSGYIPMSAPIQRLQVPEKPGFVRYWFRGEPARIQRALQAGYKFVNPEDVKVNNFDLGGDAKVTGNTDLGSRVSIVSGGDTDPTGNPNRLYLMEIPEELYEKGQKHMEEVNDRVAAAMRAGLVGADDESAVDRSKRYLKTGVPDLFNPNKIRRR